MKYYMILSDNDTYSELDGCSIVAVPDFVPEDDVDDYIKKSDGFYCFKHKPEFESNNDFDIKELEDEEYEQQRIFEEYEEARDNWFRRDR